VRRIAIINQKGGVGKTTTTANLGAALAIQGRRVVLVDMDAQANLSCSLGVEAKSGSPSSYTVLTSNTKVGKALRDTAVPRLRILPANLDLSGAELELAAAMGREFILRDALREWVEQERARTGRAPADYVLFDCPPSLGLLSINALAAAGEVIVTMQTEFLALQGMSKLVEVVQLLKKRLNPELVITGIVPCLYDSRLRLAREVLAEIRTYFKGQVFPHPVRANVKLAEAPSFGQTVFEYAPDSKGADDYMRVAREVMSREERDEDLRGLPAFDASARLMPKVIPAPRKPPPPPPRKPKANAADAAPASKATSATPAGAAPARDAGAPVAPTSSAPVHKAVAPPAKAPPASVPVAEHAEAPAPAKPVPSRPRESTKPASTAVPAQRREDAVARSEAPAPHEKHAPRSETPASRPESAASRGPVAPRSGHVVPRSEHVARTEPPKPRSEPRVLRADEVPPLPPDAFEILSILPSDP
jgi:chromosome partitioning protein